MRIQSSLKILAAFLLFFPVVANAKPVQVLAYFLAIEKDAQGEYSRLVVNPYSSGAITLRVRKGEIKKEFLRTVLDVELNVLEPCVLTCEAELIRVVDIIAPHELPEGFTERRAISSP